MPKRNWVCRVRTRSRSGLLLLLVSKELDRLTLELREGSPCLGVHIKRGNETLLCTSDALDDGQWHHIQANR